MKTQTALKTFKVNVSEDRKLITVSLLSLYPSLTPPNVRASLARTSS